MARRGPGHRKKGGDKKHGRNKVKCARYKLLGKREKSRIKKLRKHADAYPNDAQARVALAKLVWGE